MSIQHRDIQDGYIHEPKGIVTATSGLVYVAEGNGSGTWKQIGSNTLKGLSGDSGVANKPLVSDGSGGFKFANTNVYAQIGSGSTAMNITTPKAAPNVYDNTAYGVITGQWTADVLNNASFSTNLISVYYSGLYIVTFDANLVGWATSTGSVGFKYCVNGTGFQVRPAVFSMSAGSGSATNTINPHVSQTAFVNLTAGDALQWMVCTTAGTAVSVSDCNLTLRTIQAS